MYSDSYYLKGIRSSDQKAIAELYRQHFGMVRKMVLTVGGSQQDVKDIYHESLMVLVSQVQNPEFNLTSKLKTYLYAIAKNKCLSLLRSMNNVREMTLEHQPSAAAVKWDELEEKEKRIMQMEKSLGELGDPCASLLTDFYIGNLSIPEITEKYQYNNNDSAKNQKYKCLMRLRRIYFSAFENKKQDSYENALKTSGSN